ncbi:putative signal transduction histidine kinase [Microbacterium sp. TS-1]|uniref:hypothetical protein n=1 Tax=Microbacterium sp. TS-1 TaxID=1344956 RepID=UPI0003901C8C|nr:hypothetical protein [Microbacterium sp. TS-1]GAD35108.1 putative signal transduction histidine kinase [Microbacterium sp. TS-1]
MTTWWSAVSGGGFYTRWSAAVSLLVAGIFSVPSVGGVGIEAYLRGAAVAALGWAVLAALLVPVAVAERRMSSRAGRGALVLGALLVVATMRSFVNDAISSALFGIVPSGPMPSRIATNLVTAVALLSIVAVITSRHAASRAAADRLRAALARVASAEARRQRIAAEAREALVSGIAMLRRSRERMLDGPVDFEAVRAFSEDVRGLSHRVDRLLRSYDDDGPLEPPLPDDADAPLSMRLVAPPWLSVAPLYALACFPYAVAAGGAGVGLAGLVGGILVDLVAGVAVRRWARPPRPAAFVAVWTAAGAGMSVVTYLFLPRIGVLGLVPVLAVPVVAVLVGLCRDALSRAGADERRAAGGLAEVAREAAEVDESAPVRRGVDVLHRPQGACVVFAARADERAPTPDEVADFRSRTEAAFRAILHAGSDERMPPGESLDRLIEAWAPAVAVTQRIDDAVRMRLRDPETAERVVSVVTEALVNAVKHSGARRAQVVARVTGSGSLLLRVASPGRLAPRPGRGLGTIGRRVFQDGGDVVLETVLPASR